MKVPRMYCKVELRQFCVESRDAPRRPCRLRRRWRGERVDRSETHEEEDSDVNTLDGLGEVLLGVLGLSSGDGSDLSS